MSFSISDDSFSFESSFEHDSELFTSGNIGSESNDSGLSSMKKYSSGSLSTDDLHNQLHS